MGVIFTCSGASQLFVTLDSLQGKGQIRRAGSQQWKGAQKGEHLFNNDVIRIGKKGFGLLQWPDKTDAFMHGGSQILVNLAQPAEEDQQFSYATVFFGAAFFVVNKIIPETTKRTIQIYTPTAVISIRGTSFLLDVAPKTGTTSVKVLCGTVRVRCIKKNSAIYLGAPHKTIVQIETAPLLAQTLLTADIDTLRSWIPSPVIDREIALHLAEAKRNKLVISGRIDEKCIVMPLVNESTYTGSWNLPQVLTTELVKRLLTSNSRLKIKIDTAGATRKVLQQRSDARFLLYGSIKTFNIVNHAAITVAADTYLEKAISRVTVILQLYDTKDQELLFEETFADNRTEKRSVANAWETVEKLPLDLDNEQFAGSILGITLNQVLTAAAEKITVALMK